MAVPSSMDSSFKLFLLRRAFSFKILSTILNKCAVLIHVGIIRNELLFLRILSTKGLYVKFVSDSPEFTHL